jgi:outer membrane protein assembly factor BamD
MNPHYSFENRPSSISARTALLALSLFVAITLSACSVPKEEDRTAGWTVEEIYKEASDEIQTGRYEDGIKLLQTLEARYPFGPYAQQAQIDMAWAYYKDDSPGLALATIDRFVKLHPNHPQTDYVYYLKGLANFNQRNTFLERLGGQDLSERDLQAARESFDAFKTVVTDYPTSKYVSDSQQRMRFLLNSIATGEVSVARFYFLRHAYVAAANRAQEVVRQYQTVPAVEEALFIMMRSYQELGLTELSDGAKRVLDTNFPNSQIAQTGITAPVKRWWQIWR